MYHTTGFTKAEITELCARIEARELSPRMRRWPPILGLLNALTVTLTYLRRNRVQAAMTTIALENPECSSRPTRATGSAIKDTWATKCSRPSGSLKAANYWIGNARETYLDHPFYVSLLQRLEVTRVRCPTPSRRQCARPGSAFTAWWTAWIRGEAHALSLGGSASIAVVVSSSRKPPDWCCHSRA